jgi:cobaltochelatase CobN
LAGDWHAISGFLLGQRCLSAPAGGQGDEHPSARILGGLLKNADIRTLAEEVRRVVRTRLLNPKWIEGMKRHGYKGAGDISKRVGRVYGWEATTEEVDDWIFDDIARTFILDEENRKFFQENNPWAMEEMGRRLLEASSRGL